MATPDLLGSIRTCSSLRTWNLSSGFVGFALGCWSWTRTWFGFHTCLHRSGSSKDCFFLKTQHLTWTGGEFVPVFGHATQNPGGSDVVGLVTTDVSEPRCQNQMLLLVPSQVLSHVPSPACWAKLDLWWF